MSVHPVEGWVSQWASYGMVIVRAVVTGIRDRGPLHEGHVLAIIKMAGIGADVAKASPIFDYDDGARRILNLLVDDIDVIQRRPDGDYYVEPEVRSAFSTALNRFIDAPSADAIIEQRESSRRIQHLRRWIATEPFKTVWRNGLRPHTDAEIAAMADYIQQVGYYGPHIVNDQYGVIIDGHLRAAALDKLGRDPVDYTEEIFFPNDLYRLAWIINVHYVDGRWPADLRKEIKRYIDHTMARSGVKLEWPADIPLITGRFDELPVKAVAPRVDTPESAAGTRRPKPLPGRGTQIAIAMMRMLEANRPVTLEELNITSSSVLHRARGEGHPEDPVLVTLKKHRYELTDLGRRQAKEIWERDRPLRDLPS